MSGVKKLFSDKKQTKDHKYTTYIPLTSLSGVAITGSAESARLLRAKQAYSARLIPQVDFSTASNFAIYGSKKRKT